MMETIAVLSDVELLASHRTGLDDIEVGQVVEGEDLLAQLPRTRQPRERR